MNNKYLLLLLQELSKLDGHIKLNSLGESQLLNEGNVICKITTSSIEILDKNFTQELTPYRSPDSVKIFAAGSVSKLLNRLMVTPNSLNHLGISYSCSNFNVEILKLKQLVDGHPSLNIYEEPSDSKNQKWLFISNYNKPEEPIFEIVLNQRVKPIVSSFVPHFQIDIDTDMSPGMVKRILEDCLGKDLFLWELDVPGYEVPLIMVRLASINGFKIYLGIGTSIRGDRTWHRKEWLRLIDGGLSA
jgi:hypothetical protein